MHEKPNCEPHERSHDSEQYEVGGGGGDWVKIIPLSQEAQKFKIATVLRTKNLFCQNPPAMQLNLKSVV